LFVCAAVVWIVGPLLVQALAEVLPAHTFSTPTSADGAGGPAGTISQLLLTGIHPALSYMSCLLVGLGLGRVRLRDTGIQVRVLAVGAVLAVLALFAQGASSFVSYASGGYDGLLTTSGTGGEGLGEVLVWAPDVLPTDTPWWPLITPALTDTAWTIAAGLGVGLLVLGSCLLATKKLGAWLLPLSALGTMALSLYTAHLVALSFQAHYDQPYLWYVLNLVVAALFAVTWQRALGRGPLEQVVSTTVTTTRRTVLRRVHRR
jgi:hypothetical protein